MTPDFKNNGFAYIPAAALPSGLLSPNTLLIKADREDKAALERDITEALDGYSVFLTRDSHPSVNMFDNEINQHKMISGIYPFVFLAIALLTIMTTMTRIITAQRCR
jgi:putative ABC transport system permease protein